MVTSLQGDLLHAVRSLTTTGSQSTQPLDKEAIDRQQPSDPTAAPNGSADAGRAGRTKTEEDTSSWKATPLQKAVAAGGMVATADRKSTRLNSSHSSISYAVFCLK